MSPRSGEPGRASVRRFFLERSPDEGEAVLAAWETEHALRVLRLRAGDRLVGLDGRGGAWPLVVAGAERGTVRLRSEGEPARDPPPGFPGAALPWIEVALSWPKASRAEPMLDRLTQLGAAAVRTLVAARSEPGAEGRSAGRRARLDRVVREACKQCGRTWPLVLRDESADLDLRDPSSLAKVRGDVVCLEPSAGVGLSAWALGRRELGKDGWTPERPLVLVVGPEGGLTDDEREALRAGGAEEAQLGPHVLRIETAAEAATAVLASALLRTGRS